MIKVQLSTFDTINIGVGLPMPHLRQSGSQLVRVRRHFEHVPSKSGCLTGFAMVAIDHITRIIDIWANFRRIR
jgi:hypothetical protein